MLPTLQAVAGKNKVLLTPSDGAEDFLFYQDKIPGSLLFFIGLKAKASTETAPHHTPDFY
jgi:amidohydrolase